MERVSSGGSSRTRGRPKKPKGVVSLPVLEGGSGSSSASSPSEVSSPSGGPSGGYFTRAKKTWLLGKVLGLEYPGSDLEAIRGLEEEFRTGFSA